MCEHKETNTRVIYPSGDVYSGELNVEDEKNGVGMLTPVDISKPRTIAIWNEDNI